MTLLHWADAWHNSEHSARLSTAAGEFAKYVFMSGLQPLFDNPVVDVVGAFVVVVGAVVVAAVVPLDRINNNPKRKC